MITPAQRMCPSRWEFYYQTCNVITYFLFIAAHKTATIRTTICGSYKMCFYVRIESVTISAMVTKPELSYSIGSDVTATPHFVFM